MYKHILLAVDLSDENSPIAEKALTLQKITGARLSLMHVIAPLPAVYSAYGIYGTGDVGIATDVVASTEVYEENAIKALEPLAEKLAVDDNNIVVKSGNESDEILDYATEHDVDLIVTGSHGRHGLRLLLGSTANAILHGAKCDVLAVRIEDNK